MKTTHIIRTAALPFLLLTGLFSCNSDLDEAHTTRVSGKVVNRFTQEPIEGAKVSLIDGIGVTSPFDVGSNSSDEKTNGLTDANGEFSLELTGEHEAFLAVGKEHYTFDPNWNDGVSVGVKSYGYGGSYENQVLEMQGAAGFNPLFVSTVPVNPTDSLVVLFEYIKPGIPASRVKAWLSDSWSELCIGQQSCRLVPTFPLEEFVAPMTGDTYAEYQTAYTRNGKWETKIGRVYVKSLEVYTDTIYY